VPEASGGGEQNADKECANQGNGCGDGEMQACCGDGQEGRRREKPGMRCGRVGWIKEVIDAENIVAGMFTAVHIEKTSSVGGGDGGEYTVGGVEGAAVEEGFCRKTIGRVIEAGEDFVVGAGEEEDGGGERQEQDEDAVAGRDGAEEAGGEQEEREERQGEEEEGDGGDHGALAGIGVGQAGEEGADGLGVGGGGLETAVQVGEGGGGFGRGDVGERDEDVVDAVFVADGGPLVEGAEDGGVGEVEADARRVGGEESDDDVAAACGILGDLHGAGGGPDDEHVASGGAVGVGVGEAAFVEVAAD